MQIPDASNPTPSPRRRVAASPRRSLFLLLAPCFLLLLLPALAQAATPFPPPEFTSGYQLPDSQYQLPVPRSPAWQYIDIAALTLALSLAAWLVLKKRSRRAVFLLMAASLIYFGFYRKGCICSIGSIQNVAYAIFNPGYALPWVVAAFFLLPLVFTLFFGRVFCSGVCPLGAIQDAVLWKPIQLPAWLEAGLGLFPYVYIGLAVLLAATGSDFAICQYDPFVGFFRLSGPTHMIFLGAVILAASMFVGRIYCRFICPYSVLLRLLAPLAKWRVSITPTSCVNCRLCEQSCPFGAIKVPSPPAADTRIGSHDRWRLITALVLLPALPLLFAFLGHRVGPQLAQVDSIVALAQTVQQNGPVPADLKDAVDAFRASARPPAELYAEAAAIQSRFVIGMTLVGVWLGLVIAAKFLASALKRRRTDYTADPASCLSCARCYQFCPVDAAAPDAAPESLVHA